MLTTHRLGTGLIVLGLGTVLFPFAMLSAQAPAASNGAAFEVASVKANTSGDLRAQIQAPPGRLVATNVPLRAIIRYAYQLPDYQVEGGPRWTSERYDIVAKAEENVPNERVRMMLQTLLAERFKLVAHHETREVPTFDLVLARSDGRLGERLRRSTLECKTAAQAQPGPYDPKTPCGYFGPAPDVSILSGILGFRGMSLDTFARSLTPLIQRPVINKTGLDGFFDADFDAPAELPPPPPPPGVPDPFDRSAFRSIFAMLPQDLGLKLEPSHSAVDVLIIDSIQRPVED